MKDAVYEWAYSLLISGCIISIILYLCPENKTKNLIETGCTCVMIIVSLMPLLHLDLYEYEKTFQEYMNQLEETQLEFENSSTDINKKLIEQEFAEYILNEAERNGVHLNSVYVHTQKNEDGIHVPDVIEYHSNTPIPQNFIMQMKSDLGIPTERQFVYETTRNDTEVIK